jgi:hypothetical protein
MLFDEVAINPECVCDEVVLDALRHRFGWSQGRLVCAFPTNWKERMLQIANTMPDGLTKSRIKDLSSRLPLVKRPSTSNNESVAWLDVVTKLHHSNPFDGIVDLSAPNEPGWYSPDRMEEYIYQSEMRIGHFDIAHQKSVDIIRNLSAFLDVNKRLVLVNAYQWFFKNPLTTDLFEQIMKVWIQNGGQSFRVVRSLREEHQRWTSECYQLGALLNKLNYKGDFTFIAVQDDEKRLHERYLIGSICGLELGYGLELGGKPQAWKLLRHSSYAQVKQNFMDRDVRDDYQEYEEWRFVNGKTFSDTKR